MSLFGFLLVCFKHAQTDNAYISKKDLLIWTRKLPWSRAFSFLLFNNGSLNRQINESFFIQAHIFKTLNTVILLSLSCISKHKHGVN